MNEDKRLEETLQSSFLGPLLTLDGITDVSYNGRSVFYKTSLEGRKKSAIEASDEEVGAFLRQIANLSERQFSYSDPILDVSFGIYRLSAVFHSISRIDNLKCYSFSLRIASAIPVLLNDPGFFPGDSKSVLLQALKEGKSIAIGGQTGAGKTELQKYLISQLDPNRRVIVIDNVEELELSRGNGAIDLTSWLVSPSAPYATYQDLIRAALRADPDYLIVAEARGKEMLECLNSAFSGCPVITTLHSFDLESMPMRMARMAMMGDPNLDMEALLGDIYHHFPLFVYVSKEEENGKIVRHIDGIGYSDEEGRRVARL